MKRFISFYDGIAPEKSDREFTDEIVRKVNDMDKNNMNTNARTKKLPWAIAAAAALFVGAGTVAAATGLLDFNGVFGNVISAEDPSTADMLVAGIKDFSYCVSDPDYIIIPKGVTGTEQTFLAAFEIARADGAPVSDHFLYSPEDNELFSANHCGAVIPLEERLDYGAGVDESSFRINEKGNIDVVFGMSYSTDITGRTIRMNFADLYEIDKLWKFRDDNSAYMYFVEDGRFIEFYDIESGRTYDAEFFANGSDKSAVIDSGEIVLHELDWAVEFVYEPSAAAMTLRAEDVSEHFTEKVNVGYDEYADITCIMDSIELNGINAVIDYHYDKEEASAYDSFDGLMDHDMFLITRSGRHIVLAAEFGCSEQHENGEWSVTMTAKTVDDNGDRIVADLSDIAAISVNGTVYTLS